MDNKHLRMLILKDHMDLGALESHIIRILRNLDTTQIEFDFLLNQKECFHKKEIERLGGRIYTLPNENDMNLRRKELINFIKQKNYQIVVRVVESIDNFRDFEVLESLKIEATIARISSKIMKIDNILWKKLFNVLLVIADENAKFEIPANMYSKVIKIKNALQLRKYRFNQDTRNRYRQELNFNDDFIVGNVARFYREKNHRFLISIFKQFNLKYPQSKLVLVGDGELRSEIVELISQYHLTDKVALLGMRDDIANILMAMDIFCLSSYEENAINSILEAQASGLYCIASNSISEKANITGTVQYLSLDSPEEWINLLSQKSTNSQSIIRESSVDILKKAGYDIIDVIHLLSDYYNKQKTNFL